MVVELSILDWDECKEDLRTEGYKMGPGPRPLTALVDGAAADREIAEDCECSGCGQHCDYVAMHHVDEQGNRDSWKSFMVCYRCNRADEF